MRASALTSLPRTERCLLLQNRRSTDLENNRATLLLREGINYKSLKDPCGTQAIELQAWHALALPYTVAFHILYRCAV